jgi:anti-sigma regulatory factor (Ser/Thr protein kinase)
MGAPPAGARMPGRRGGRLLCLRGRPAPGLPPSPALSRPCQAASTPPLAAPLWPDAQVTPASSRPGRPAVPARWTALRPGHADVNWEKSYPGTPETARAVRRDVRAVLSACPEPVVELAELVVSELAANSVLHSRSGHDGGTYTVRVSHFASEKAPCVWVEVEDLGSPSWDGVLRPEPTHGLSLIQRLSTWIGSDRGPGERRVVHARLEYDADGSPLVGAPVPDLPGDLRGVRERELPGAARQAVHRDARGRGSSPPGESCEFHVPAERAPRKL